MMRRPKWMLSLSYGLVFAIASGLVVLAVLYAILSNSRDNQDPARQVEMVEITLEWGQLAPFPAKAQNFSIRTEGDMFTRSFRASFNASEEEIESWIAESPGLMAAQIEVMPDGKQKYIIPPGGGANYAEAIIDHKTSRVEVYVSWG